MTAARVLRTPEECFASLPGFPFLPRYAVVNGLRMHYVDEGPASGETVLLLHGEPTWSYLYRKMIPPLVNGGLRTVAPDLVGFGRSDKLLAAADYSYAFHVATVRRLIETLDLSNITLFGQDWGGLIGLRVLAEVPHRFARVVAANTMLPTADIPLSEAFFQWRAFSQRVPEFRPDRIVSKGCVSPVPAEVAAAYAAPFPDERYLAGARVFPMLVPARADDPAEAANRAAWRVLERWTRPFLTTFSDRDPITAGGERILQERIPGARGCPHVTVKDAGHFLQEDRGEDLGHLVLDFVRSTPLPTS